MSVSPFQAFLAFKSLFFLFLAFWFIRLVMFYRVQLGMVIPDTVW